MADAIVLATAQAHDADVVTSDSDLPTSKVSCLSQRNRERYAARPQMNSIDAGTPRSGCIGSRISTRA
jgi:hypothetical protein